MKRKFPVLPRFLSIIISLLIAVSIYFYLIKYNPKQKHLLPYYVKKWQTNKCFININSNDELKETDTKNCTCNYLDDIIKIEDFNLDNISIDGKSYENILVYNILYKTLIDAKPLRIRLIK